MNQVTERRTAQRRRAQADSIQALDVFAGFGGMSQALEAAGVAVIHAANHNPFAVDVHKPSVRRAPGAGRVRHTRYLSAVCLTGSGTGPQQSIRQTR